MMKSPNRRSRPIVLVMSLFGMLLVSHVLSAQSGNPPTSSPRKIGYWDSTLALVDGIDPEVYVMMKDADAAMTDLIRAAAIYAKADPSQATVPGMIDRMLKDGSRTQSSTSHRTTTRRSAPSSCSPMA